MWVNAARLSGSNPPPSNESALFSRDYVRNERGEVGHGAVQNIEELARGTAAVGCLLRQFRHYQRLFLAENLDLKGLRVQRTETPYSQVLWPEVAKVEGSMIAASPWTAAATTWRSFSTFAILGISEFSTADPGLAEVGLQLLLKMRHALVLLPPCQRRTGPDSVPARARFNSNDRTIPRMQAEAESRR